MANASRGLATAPDLYGMVPAGRNQRSIRRPQHSWNVFHPAWGIQPIAIVPVLPGDTLKGFSWQARAVTDPIKNPLCGWWLEYYWFYVKHRDLKISQAMQDMVLDPGSNQSASYGSGASAVTYHKAGSTTFNYTQECLKVVVEENFRFGVDDWDAYMVDTSWPAAQVQLPGWMDSVMKGSDYTTEDPTLAIGGDAAITASEVDTLLRKWRLLMSQGVIGDVSYEDFLRSYGVRIPQADEPGRPELLRYVRDWSYPSNTVNPADGIPASAVSWAIQERGDKDRFFREPGFIFGISVCRPKVYVSYQEYAAAHWLQDAYAWLPTVLNDNAGTAVRVFAAGTGPLPLIDVDYVVDLRDLYAHGDQFVNYTLGATPSAGRNLVELPVEATLQRRFATTAMADALFKTTGTRYLRQDGVATFHIASRVVDMTPATGL